MSSGDDTRPDYEVLGYNAALEGPLQQAFQNLFSDTIGVENYTGREINFFVIGVVTGLRYAFAYPKQARKFHRMVFEVGDKGVNVSPSYVDNFAANNSMWLFPERGMPQTPDEWVGALVKLKAKKVMDGQDKGPPVTPGWGDDGELVWEEKAIGEGKHDYIHPWPEDA